MISILVNLLIVALIVWVILYVIGMLGLPQPAAMIAKVIVAVVVLVYCLQLLGVATGSPLLR